MVVKEKINKLGTKQRWVSSEVQIADGTTKIMARQLLADRLQTDHFCLQSDGSFQAAKKKIQADRHVSARRNTIGRMISRGNLGYIVLTNKLLPVKAEDPEQVDHYFDVIFVMLLIVFTIFLVQCFQRMSTFL